MDRASILGDAIEYLKELLQRINDLHNELESTPSSSSISATTTSCHPLTPTPPTLPSRVKEELCPNSLASPTSQPPRVSSFLLGQSCRCLTPFWIMISKMAIASLICFCDHFCLRLSSFVKNLLSNLFVPFRYKSSH